MLLSASSSTGVDVVAMSRSSEEGERWDAVVLPSWNDTTVLILDNAIDNTINSSVMILFDILFVSMINCDSAG